MPMPHACAPVCNLCFVFLQDGLIDNVFDLLLDHLSSYSHHIAFPELVLPVLLKVKAFCKKTKVPKFQQQMRQLVTKVFAKVELCQRRSCIPNLSGSSVEVMTVDPDFISRTCSSKCVVCLIWMQFPPFLSCHVRLKKYLLLLLQIAQPSHSARKIPLRW